MGLKDIKRSSTVFFLLYVREFIVSMLITSHLHAQNPSPSPTEELTKHAASSPYFEEELTGSNRTITDPNAFFHKKGMGDLFGGTAEISEPQKINALNPTTRWKPTEEEKVALKKEFDTKDKSKEKIIPHTKEEILKAYGDPNKDVPIMPTEDQHSSLKGFYAAVAAKDDDLAYQYRKQYERYKKEVLDKADYFAKTSDAARIGAGIVPALPGLELSADDPFSAQLLRDLEKQKRDGLTKKVAVDDGTRTILEGDIKDDPKAAEGTSNAISSSAFSYQETPEEVRALLSQKVPVDSGGRGKFFIFVGQGNPDEFPIIKELSEMQKTRMKNLELVCVTAQKVKQETLVSIAHQVGSLCQVRDGSELARRFGISHTPALVAYAPTSREAFVDQTPKRGVYLQEMVKIMLGE